MAQPQFSIGIDLGTTNCAMAFEGSWRALLPGQRVSVPHLTMGDRHRVFPRPQHYLRFFTFRRLDEAGADAGPTIRCVAEWIPGRFARTRAAASGRGVSSIPQSRGYAITEWIETPRSCHGDRMRFPVEKRISPIPCFGIVAWRPRAPPGTPSFADQGLPFDGAGNHHYSSGFF